MSDTNILQFSLRERAWLATEVFKPSTTEGSPYPPGQLLRIVCDPIGAIVKLSRPESGEPAHYACPLAMTLSRFRDFKYVGTKLSLVPAATNAQVDPAHISDSKTGNFVHPKDLGNMIHWRRWVGGNIRVPSIVASSTDIHGNPIYSEFDCYDLDAAWLSDTRFNHALVSDGFEMFVKPLRANLQTSAAATVSLFGYYDDRHVGLDDVDTVGQTMPTGSLAITAGDVTPDSWVPNPFAGFHYSTSRRDVGDELVTVNDYNHTFPWFADVGDVSALAPTLSVASLYQMVRNRFLAPLCVLRLPPAYGTIYYWTLYMRHYFAVRRPYITNGTYTAAMLQRFDPYDPVPGSTGLRMMRPVDDTTGKYHVVQMIGADPYGAEESIASLSMEDCRGSIWTMTDGDEPTEPSPEPQPEPEPKKKHPAEAEYVEVDS